MPTIVNGEVIFVHEPNESLRYGLNEDEYETLAYYNQRVALGIQHTLTWDRAMQELQRKFDAAGEASRDGEGG